MKENKKIILFDGVCNLCNGAVQFIIRQDKNDTFRFAALQSEKGQQLIKERGIDTNVIDSIILIKPNVAYYIKSDAALEIANNFGGGWKFLQIFKLLPTSIRDFFYDFIARNRYRWFGQKNQCMIPTPELRAKFID